jgi:response regulator RpfG family c-di-GMP phosphodiesterase
MHESKPYILLIDDDEDDLEMYSSELEKKGFKVKAFDFFCQSTLLLIHHIRNFRAACAYYYGL